MSAGLVGLAAVAALLAGCGGVTPVRAPTGAATTSHPAPQPSTGRPSPASSRPAATPSPASRSPRRGSPPPAAAPLRPGDAGPRVLALQRRLAALGYWLGNPDGVFGDATEQAVYALQKAAGLARDGVVGPATTTALAAGVRPRPRSRVGHVIEVDLADDLLLIVTNGHLDAVLNTSTGGGYRYTVDGVTALALTPVGVFHVYREVDAMVVDSLGELWRPKYFDAGFAVHGDAVVPPVPVSHGCVRVSTEAIDWIWSSGQLPVGSTVWVY